MSTPDRFIFHFFENFVSKMGQRIKLTATIS
jgi:hypothetical protein